MTQYNPLPLQGHSLFNKPDNQDFSRLAYILSSDIRGKIEYTFDTFVGDCHETSVETWRYGILDYMGFILPRLLRRGLVMFDDTCNTPFFRCTILIWIIPVTVLRILCYIIDVVVRNLLAFLITAVLALPIVLIFHPITELVKNSIEENIDRLKVELQNSAKEPVVDEDCQQLYGSFVRTFSSKAENGAYNQFWITKKDDGKLRLNMVVGCTTVKTGDQKFFKDYVSSEELNESSLVKEIMRLS